MHDSDNLKNVVNGFEALTLTGFFPLISTYTHHKPHCRPSCIDNIFTNDIDTVQISGTISGSPSHHYPVFQFFNIDLTKNPSKTTVPTQFYDFFGFFDEFGRSFGMVVGVPGKLENQAKTVEGLSKSHFGPPFFQVWFLG